MIYEPGVHSLTNDAYHSSQGISRSAIMKFRKSPLHYWHEYINPLFIKPESTPQMIIGSALHTLMLEPEIFNDEFAVKPEMIKLPKVPLLRDAGRESYDQAKREYEFLKGKNEEVSIAFEANSVGKLILSFDDFEKVKGIAAALCQRTQAIEILSGGVNEQSIYWSDPDSGLYCKARPDVWHDNMIGDLKTTADASLRACQSSVYAYGYHIQAAMIIDGIKWVTGREINNFIDLFVEKEEPYAHAIYVLDDECIEAGRKEYKAVLMRMRECYNNDEWPSYQTSTISLPKWASFD